MEVAAAVSAAAEVAAEVAAEAAGCVPRRPRGQQRANFSTRRRAACLATPELALTPTASALAAVGLARPPRASARTGHRRSCCHVAGNSSRRARRSTPYPFERSIRWRLKLPSPLQPWPLCPLHPPCPLRGPTFAWPPPPRRDRLGSAGPSRRAPLRPSSVRIRPSTWPATPPPSPPSPPSEPSSLRSQPTSTGRSVAPLPSGGQRSGRALRCAPRASGWRSPC